MQEDCNLLNQTFSGNTTLKLIKKHLNIEHTTRKPVVYIPSFIITRALCSTKFKFIFSLMLVK